MLGRGSELREHKELAEFEAGDDGASSGVGDVILVAPADAPDETMDTQAAEVKRMLYRFMQSRRPCSTRG
jgi:hypothetical protein